MGNILKQLRKSDAMCVAPPQDWTTRAADEIERLRNQVAVAKTIVSAGIDLMTKEQIGQWRGVRSFLEQETEDYEPFAEPPNVELTGAARHEQQTKLQEIEK